jgi:Uma2 family endonuclease
MSTPTLLTWEEFKQTPEHVGKQELLRGELLELPPASARDSRIFHRIFFRLMAALQEAHARGEATSLGGVRIRLGYRLGGATWLNPDASITHAEQPEGDYMEGAPAIAIEVVSSDDTPRTLSIKTELYFEFGAREVWRVSRDQGHVVVHVAGAGSPVTIRDFVRTPLLPGFTLNVQEILGV